MLSGRQAKNSNSGVASGLVATRHLPTRQAKNYSPKSRRDMLTMLATETVQYMYSCMYCARFLLQYITRVYISPPQGSAGHGNAMPANGDQMQSVLNTWAENIASIYTG